MSEYGSAFFKVGVVILLFFVNNFRILLSLYSYGQCVIGKTIGTPRPNGLGQLLVEARAEDGQVCTAVAAAYEDG